MDGAPFVAHRGDPGVHPENTLGGALSAIDRGARFFEVDIQVTRDQVAILHHDGDLMRMSGVTGTVGERTLAELQRHGVFHPERFGQAWRGTPITTLRQLLDRIAGRAVQVFVEIKTESMGWFGRDNVLGRVLNQLLNHQPSIAAVISKDVVVAEYVRKELDCKVGWVLPAWDRQTQEQSRAWELDYLFCDQSILPKDPAKRWRGPWKWVVYTVNDVDTAFRLLAEGIDMIETDAIGEMLGAWENRARDC